MTRLKKKRQYRRSAAGWQREKERRDLKEFMKAQNHPLLKLGYSIYDKVRRRLADDQDWRCYYCQEEMTVTFTSDGTLATIEHKLPLSRGGSWKRFNLVCACRSCNRRKGHMTSEEFMWDELNNYYEDQWSIIANSRIDDHQELST